MGRLPLEPNESLRVKRTEVDFTAQQALVLLYREGLHPALLLLLALSNHQQRIPVEADRVDVVILRVEHRLDLAETGR